MPAPAYLSCIGETQGLITRDASTEDSVGSIYVAGHENECMVLSFNFTMSIPTDPESGEHIGPRQHQPFTIIKDIDKATPLLAVALATGEHLKECILNCYRISARARQEQYYSIRLFDAQILHISQGMPNTRSGVECGPIETISFSYRKIEWVHKASGTSGADSWQRPI